MTLRPPSPRLDLDVYRAHFRETPVSLPKLIPEDQVMFESLLADVREEFPTFVIRAKAGSWLMRAVNAALFVITIGLYRDFMSTYTTVIGRTMYVPDTWGSSYRQMWFTLRHERIHFRQQSRYTRLGFSLLYLFLPFPILFAYYRRKFEQEAYEETLRARAEYFGVAAFTNDEMKKRLISYFSTYRYFWAWPWRSGVERWYEDTVAKIKKEMPQ